MVETQETARTLQLEQLQQKSPQKSLGSDKLLCYISFCNKTPGFGDDKQTWGFEKIKRNAEAGRESRHGCGFA